MANQAAEIKQLKDSLNSVLSRLPSRNSTAHPPSTNPAANALQPQNNNLSQDISDDDLRKHNVVIFGIEECASGTDKLERVKHDFCKVLDVCSAIDTSRTSGSAIRHTVRLGKYSSSPRHPRPILVKLNSTAYASNLLANKKQCPEGINLKPDLPLQVRQIESLLLKERWQLIQDGCDRKSIRIRGSNIFLNGKIFASVIDGRVQKDSNAVNIESFSPVLNSQGRSASASPPDQSSHTGTETMNST